MSYTLLTCSPKTYSKLLVLNCVTCGGRLRREGGTFTTSTTSPSKRGQTTLLHYPLSPTLIFLPYPPPRPWWTTPPAFLQQEEPLSTSEERAELSGGLHRVLAAFRLSLPLREAGFSPLPTNPTALVMDLDGNAVYDLFRPWAASPADAMSQPHDELFSSLRVLSNPWNKVDECRLWGRRGGRGGPMPMGTPCFVNC